MDEKIPCKEPRNSESLANTAPDEDTAPFSPADLSQMAGLGIDPSEALRQIELFRNPPPFTRVLRACRVGDGIRQLSKVYGGFRALDAVDLDVRSGEFLTLLGPSGSGKSTLLMALAGFSRPTAGSIAFDGEDVTRRPPHKRNIGVVFQNYALFRI